MDLRKIRYIYILLSVIITGFQYPAQQKWQKEPLKTEPPVCYASDETGHSFVSPPAEFLKKLKSGKKTSDIIIKYVNFPDSIKPAMEYAAEIWEYLISSPVPIYMEARWQVLGSTTLGSCGPSSYYINFKGAPLANTYYPVAVVEKILEEEKTGSANVDLSAKFNSSIAWYIGTDGKTPSNKYDFVSTALHEIAHGLGFVGFFYVRTSNTTGYYGNNDNYPSIFDRYVEDYNSKKLTDNNYYKNGTNGLYQALISNQLYSGSPVAAAWYFQNRPRLYAPASYKDGSSIYHLNDASYSYGNENALMTSSAGKGEAVHSPGPLSSGIMADIGWKYMYIRYQTMKDIEEIVQPLDFKVSVDSDLGLKSNSLYLVKSKDGFKSAGDSILFGKPDSAGYYTATLSQAIGSGRISYYFSARDTVGRIFTLPVQAPGASFALTIGPDTVKPVISHVPPSYVLSLADEIDISAIVTDNIGIDTVEISFLTAGNELVISGLVRGKNGHFSGKFCLSDLGLKGGDSVRYSLVAVDVANRKNTTYWPVTGRFPVSIESVRNPVTAYETDFNTGNNDFILTDFTINKEKGFDNAALNTQHPYPSPDTDNSSLEYSTVLRYPVIISADGKMGYDEVVLVEPGESGAVFGSEDFYDYVIVEGSKDSGKTWVPFLDGYDSGNQTSWITAYNMSFVNNNSNTAGSKDLYISHEFSLTGNKNFKAGDTVLIRFRLYSDPYAHGWGWAVDNLKIQSGTLPASMLTISPGKIMIWPNPSRDILNVSVGHEKIIKNLDVVIYDPTGRVIYNEKYHYVLPGTVTGIHLDAVRAGLFFVAVKVDGILISSRKMIKQ